MTRGKGGSVPSYTSLAGIEVMVVNVAAWDRSAPARSRPSKMRPPSMGCLNSHTADFDRSWVASSLSTNARFDWSVISMAVSMPRLIRYADWATVS